jgi:hypothetical protein
VQRVGDAHSRLLQPRMKISPVSGRGEFSAEASESIRDRPRKQYQYDDRKRPRADRLHAAAAHVEAAVLIDDMCCSA